MSPRRIVPLVGLAFLIFLAFGGVAGNGFVPYDDDTYLTRNEVVRAGLTAHGLRWAFGSVGYASNWHPLAWLSHMADVQLFGLDPRRHHLAGLALYAAACALLFQALRRGTGRPWCSFVATALFALHPLRVESVVWAAERKDVLALFFGAATIAAWIAWARRPGARWRYAAALAAFCAGLLSKPTLVVLPLLLLLLAWWPLGAWGVPGRKAGWRGAPRLLGGTALLLLPASAAGVVTVLAQRAGGGLLDASAPPLGMRVANALVAVAAYLGKLLFPRDLAVFYPFPAAIPAGAIVAAGLLLAGVTAAAWRLRRRHPAVLAGWGWYLAALLPVLGLLPVGAQSMADRYTLFPSIGAAVAAVWLAAALAGSARGAAALGAAALLVCLVPLTRGQVEVWRDGQALFTHALRVTRGNWQIEHEYGVLLLNAGRHAEAERHLRAAVRLRPDHVLARYNLGGALFWQGRAAEATVQYREAIRLRQDFVEAHYRLARALAYLGRNSEALGEYETTLRLEPGHAAALEGRRKAVSGAPSAH